MARGERTCVVCGTKYIYCPNCKKGDPTETWRYMYDSEECREIFKTCSRFAFGHIDAEAAKKKLDKYDLTDRTKYAEGIRQNLSAIYAKKAENPKEKEKPETKEEQESATNFRFSKGKRKSAE